MKQKRCTRAIRKNSLNNISETKKKRFFYQFREVFLHAVSSYCKLQSSLTKFPYTLVCIIKIYYNTNVSNDMFRDPNYDSYLNSQECLINEKSSFLSKYSHLLRYGKGTVQKKSNFHSRFNIVLGYLIYRSHVKFLSI